MGAALVEASRCPEAAHGRNGRAGCGPTLGSRLYSFQRASLDGQPAATERHPLAAGWRASNAGSATSPPSPRSRTNSLWLGSFEPRISSGAAMRTYMWLNAEAHVSRVERKSIMDYSSSPLPPRFLPRRGTS
jgi:hypothetical protein